MTAPIECKGWDDPDPAKAFNADICKNQFDEKNPQADSYLSYGSDELFGLFCFPDIEHIP
jgi:hypothetical protein